VPLHAGMARRAKGIFLLTVVMISLISATKEAPAVTFRAPRAGLVRRGTDSHHHYLKGYALY
jgi:kynureninase